MSTRRTVVIDFSGSPGAIAGPTAGHRSGNSGTGFRFDPEAWVDMAYPCLETVMVEAGGKKSRRKAQFTAEGFRKMIAGFEAEKARRASEGVGHSLLGNKDHLALMRDNSTEAYGWLDGLKIGPDGHLLGHIKWTSLGTEAALGGVYRFVSVEVEDAEGEQKPESAVLEWNRITGFAVTNDPALDLRPFCHRAGETIEEKNKPKGPKMENLKKMLGLDPNATDADVEAKVKELLDAKTAADGAAAEAEMCKKEAAFSKTHAGKFPDEATAKAFFRAAPEKADELAGRFRVVTPTADEQKADLDRRAGEFAAKHSAKFEDATAAQDFYRASPEHAETLVSKIRVPSVAHRGGGNPDEKGALTPKAAHSKWTSMPEGAEKEAFFDAHRVEINAGSQEK